MSDDLIEPFSVQEIFVDGFAKHISEDGVMRCIGYRKRGGRRVIVVRLAWPEVSTEAAITEALHAIGTTDLPVPKGLRRKIH